MSESEAVTADAVDGTAEEVTEAQVEESKPSGADLVVNRADPESVFVVLDRHDELLILEEFQRRALKVMLYDFESGGSRMVDLSYGGVLEAVQLMNRTGKCRIKISPEFLQLEKERENDEEIWVATVYATDEVTGQGAYGTAQMPVHMKLRGGKTKYDPFARTKALSKAQRNALKTMIPEPMRQTLIAQYTGNAVALKQIEAGAGAEAMAELPPPLRDERADELRARAREVYLEVRAIDPTIITPAAFDNAMRRAESAHDRLEDLIGYLEATRDSNKGGRS